MCFSLGLCCEGLFLLLGLGWLSFPILGKFSTIISSKVFSITFFFSSYSGILITRMLVFLTLSQRSLRLSSILFILFPLFCSSAVISITLSSSSLIHSSASVILLWVSARAFLGFALGGKVWLSGLYWFLLGVPCVCVLEGGNQADNYRNNRTYTHTSLMVQSVKTPPAVWETWVRSPGREDTLE